MPKQSSEKPNEKPTRQAFPDRLSPTKQQEHPLLFVLRRCRDLYNRGLEERQASSQMRRQSLGSSAQAAELAEIKAAYPASGDISRQVLQAVLRRLDKAFPAFFRRLKHGEQPGYPRFQGQGRSDSFTDPHSGFALAGWQGPGKARYALLPLSTIGDRKVRLHRPMGGQGKTSTIKRDVNHWDVTFSGEVEDELLPHSAEAIGLDLGLLHCATRSTGETIENPRHSRTGVKRLTRLSQIKDRRKKGSHRRKRAASAWAKAQRRVRHQRQDFQHQAARALANRFGTLVLEDRKMATMSAAPEPKPDPEQEGEYLPNGATAKAG